MNFKNIKINSIYLKSIVSNKLKKKTYRKNLFIKKPRMEVWIKFSIKMV